MRAWLAVGCLACLGARSGAGDPPAGPEMERLSGGLFCATFLEQGCAGFDVAWSGWSIVLTGVYTAKAQTVAWKETFTFDAPTSFTQTLDMGPPGALKAVSTIRAKWMRQ